ncbi:MAG: ATP-dependent transcriptional regulator, MalT-like, LuxR family [Lacrimispora sp.]|nr:ATP-dependent transcriptional regulator, MalT-like, LuxR family [Lacrimispora sp.]
MEKHIDLLETKFSINHIYRQKAITREHLFCILDDALDTRLTFISAPAGFGKTTLLSSWITMHKKRSISVAWLTLEAEDNEENRFWIYFISAIKSAIPDIGEKSFSLLNTSRIGGIETIITVLINEILEKKKKFLFIVDDLHVIKNKQILNELKFFINHMPDNLHLIITSRLRLLSQLSGIEHFNRIIEIGPEELKFTKSEATAYLNEIMELKVTQEELIQLYELTEGWPVGLQITALFCKRKGIESINNKQAMMFQSNFPDYFIEDILNSQSADVYEFLIKTSLLNAFSCELCQAVTDMENSDELLKQVLEMNLFISCLDQKDQWYRYHSLFAAFLRKKAKEKQPEFVKDIYWKAGHWYETKGHIQEACTSYLKAQRYDKAIHLIEQISSPLIYQGQITVIEKWIECIPAQFVFKNIRLMLDYVWIYLSRHKVSDASYYLDLIEKELKCTAPEEQLAVKGEFLIAKAFIKMDHLEESIQMLKSAMELVDQFNPNYAAALMSIATTYIVHGDVLEAEEYYSKALTASIKIENLYSAAYSWGGLGMMLTCQGRLREAEVLYQEAENYLKEKGGNSIPLLGIIFSGLSEIFYLKNDIEHAAEYSDKAIEMFEQGGIFDIKNNCYVIKARSLLAKGSDRKAFEVINKALILSEKENTYGFKRHIEYCQARIFLDMGQIEKAEDFIEQYHLSLTDYLKKYNLHDYVLLAEILVKRKEYANALLCIDEILKLDGIGSLYEVQLEILKSDALLNTSKSKAAFAELHKALIKCSRENYLRLFINYGARMQSMLNEFLNMDNTISDSRSILYAKNILIFFDDRSQKAVKENPVLTKRELEVLKLISAGASNVEIAQSLFISVSTVKSHVLNLFTKLEVNSRSKAVVEAEKRGIIHTFY